MEKEEKPKVAIRLDKTFFYFDYTTEWRLQSANERTATFDEICETCRTAELFSKQGCQLPFFFK